MAVTAKVYPDGRIMVPFRVRRMLGLVPGETFSYEIQDGKLVVWTEGNKCKCGNPVGHDLAALKLGLCRECLQLAAETYTKADSVSPSESDRKNPTV